MATSRDRRLRRWGAAVGLSVLAHVLALLVLTARQPHAPMVELPVVQVYLPRPPEPQKKEEKPKPAEKPPAPSPPPVARPVEAPTPVPEAPTVPVARPAPPAAPPPAPAATAQAAPPPRPLRLGCEGRLFDSMSPAEKNACVQSLTAFTRAPKAGDPPLAATAREKQIEAEAAAQAAREKRFSPSGNAKTGGCPEGNLGVGCTEDRLGITIYKQKF